MASFIRRFKGKSKPSEKDKEEANEDSITSERDERQKSMSLSPYTSDSDVSPQHLISQGSLFSGMKLTKTSRELEPETSPYTPGGESTNNDKSVFDFLDEGSSDNQEGSSGFTFLNQSESPETGEEQTGFSFMMADSSPPGVVEAPQNTDGFSFLSEDPNSSPKISNPQTDGHSNVSIEQESVPNEVLDISTNLRESSSVDHYSSVVPMSSPPPMTSSTPTPTSSTPTPTSLTPITITPVPSTPTHATPVPTSVTSVLPQKINRQAPPNKKKKKHKVIRPGQERNDEMYSGLIESSITSDLDGISISSHGSSSTMEPSTEEGSFKQQPDKNYQQHSANGGSVIKETLAGETMASPNNTLETTGETVMDSGDRTARVRTNDTLERNDETVVPTTDTTSEETGNMMVTAGMGDTGDTMEAAGDTGDTMEAAGDTGDISKIKDETETCNEGDDKAMMKDNLTLVNTYDLSSSGATGISSDLADVFSHVTDDHVTEEESSLSDPKPVKETGNYIVELSPIEKIATLLEATESNTKTIRDNTEEIASQFGAVLQNHFKTIEGHTKKRHLVQELKTKEASALSEENYEQAEELRKELESINVENNVTVLIEAQTTVREWLNKCSKSVSSQVLAHQDAKEKLKTLQEEQTESLTKLEKDFSSANAKEKMKLQTLRDELERERGHISLDSEHLKKRQLLLQDEVSERAAEFIARKKDLEIERKETQLEIEELEKKLKELRQKESELVVKICSEDESITSISNEFSSERDQLDLEETRLDKKKQDLLNEESSLNKLQMSFDASMKLHNENKERIEQMLKEAEVKLTEISNDQCILENTLTQCSDWDLEDIYKVLKPNDDLQRLLASELSQEDSVKQTSNEVLSLQTSISSSCRKMTDQETHLQKLQEAKKVAVSARQYRDAARLSAEEKETLASCNELREEVTKLENEVEDKNENLLAQTQELDRLREQRELVEREGDIQSIKKLALAMVAVQKKLQSISKRISYYTVLTQWKEFIKLVIEDLCTKHALDIQEYLPTTKDGERSSPSPPPSNNVMDTSNDLLYLSEERTPGVGMEVVHTVNDVTFTDELKQSIEALEMKIAECCENENFEEAAALDEELQELKNRQMNRV